MPFWPFCVGFGTSCEGRLSLAIASYYNNLKSSIYSLAKAYNAYGVLDQDIYNFNETRFAMGVAATSKVVTSSNRVGWAVIVQPGNREWVIVIKCVNASGWSLPPFIILCGKVKHFNRHTASRIAEVYRLLILDGYSSHAILEFNQYYTESKIITLCMPPYTSYLLQPLNISCFSPLKRAYGRLVPLYPERVLSSLIVVRTPGVLQVQQAQQLTTEAERLVIGSDQNQTGERRQRAPPTCTKCHTIGHTRTSCRTRS
ncbi:hypothetical protein COCSADRAFT_34397 [Bipolaris sorokiniana ND90Pr]|uniref:DDE-1 domain-containing protein n=1 Tax=Cochliobolus sativus (strain ND90Pr / ATCC 201652) TaxID=665912 RepID=M2SZ74_COCSN|nr:uncharacterized protein COCSADRAFT_34397 [Bipolaris sorokiniana ND90Pr]EMD67605.1 hypothetical protein COCSADRAFT_34397 [Bipolaris sorokiniana ND90Pr]